MGAGADASSVGAWVSCTISGSATGLGADSGGTEDKDAPEDDDDEVMLNLRGASNENGNCTAAS